jgi:hypothetical protein
MDATLRVWLSITKKRMAAFCFAWNSSSISSGPQCDTCYGQIKTKNVQNSDWSDTQSSKIKIPDNSKQGLQLTMSLFFMKKPQYAWYSHYTTSLCIQPLFYLTIIMCHCLTPHLYQHSLPSQSPTNTDGTVAAEVPNKSSEIKHGPCSWLLFKLDIMGKI